MSYSSKPKPPRRNASVEEWEWYENAMNDWNNAQSNARWEKYKSSYDRDTGSFQTDYYSGTVGVADQKKKVHVAIDDRGNVVFVRDMDGTVLYDRKNSIGYLPPNLNWSYNQ